MTCCNKTLALTVIFSIALAITGCANNPPVQNQAVSNTNSFNNQRSIPVDVSDLNSSTASYAEQQLQARGFNQTR